MAKVAATAVLGFVGTGLAYVLNYVIVARDGATVASTVTYLLPVVAVILGAVALDEPVTSTMIAGTAVVLAGVALTRRGRSSTGVRMLLPQPSNGDSHMAEQEYEA